MIYIHQELELGKTIIVKQFSFTDKVGGIRLNSLGLKIDNKRLSDTGLSRWDYDEMFDKPISVTVVKRWDDNETGERSWCIPDETNKELMDYLERNAGKGCSDFYLSHNGEDELTTSLKDKFILYIGEFDLLK